MTLMIPGVIAQEAPLAALPLPTSGDVVFQCTFEGTNGGTDAVDESPIHAPLTFSGGVTLSNQQTVLGLATTARFTDVTQYVSAPANSIYNIATNNNNGDFTVECFVRVLSFTLGAFQLVGVWRTGQGLNLEQWRLVFDASRLFFQLKQAGGLLNYSGVHNWVSDVWYYAAACRYHNILRIFTGVPGAQSSMIRTGILGGKFDDTTSPVPLTVGGTLDAQDGVVGYIADVRVTGGAWYRDDAGLIIPTVKFGHGLLFPSFASAPDVIYVPAAGQVVSTAVPPDDALFAPAVLRSPTFVNSTVTAGVNSVNVISSALVGSRTNGNLLIAWAMCMTGTHTFTVSSGWTIGDQQSDANSASAWAWRIVDGTETAAAFTWSGVASTAHTRMFQFAGVNASPIGAKAKAQGASTNLVVNGGIGLTTTGLSSAVWMIGLTVSNSQVIPLPSGYLDTGGTFNNSFGSNRQAIQSEGLTGTVSGPVNLTIGSAFWHGFMIEILR